MRSVAAVSSIGSAIDLLRDDNWKEKFIMIEVGLALRGSYFFFGIASLFYLTLDALPFALLLPCSR